MIKLEEYLNQSLRESTAKSYKYIIEKYLKSNPYASKYNYQKVMQHIGMLRGILTPLSVNREVAAIKKYYDYLIEIGKRKDNPARAIKLKDTKEKPIQLQNLLTQNELQCLLLPRVERYPILAKRNQIIISLLVHQALRIGEIQNIQLTDIDLEKATLQVKETGLTNARSLPLQASQILLLHQYINQDREQLKTWRDNKNALLLGKLGTPLTTEDINYLVSTYKNDFKIKLTALMIRQSVLANMLTKNNDLRVVQYFAGHKSPDTTEKYRQTGLNALKTAINKMHPLQ